MPKPPKSSKDSESTKRARKSRSGDPKKANVQDVAEAEANSKGRPPDAGKLSPDS